MSSESNILKFVRLNITSLLFASLFSTFSRINKPIKPYFVNTKDARFLLFMGVHGVGKVGQEVDLDKYVNQIDAVFLETGGFHYLKDGQLDFQFPKDRMEKMAFYHKVIPLLRQKQKPMLFADIPFSVNKVSFFFVIENLITTTAAIGGLHYALKNNKTKSISPVVGTVVSLWGMLNLVKRVAIANPDFIRHNTDIRQAAHTTEISHPEDIIGSFRNALIALKLIYYAKKYKDNTGRTPAIALIMGSGHELISEYLKLGEEYCYKIINRYPGFIKRILIPSNLRNYYSTLVETTYKYGSYYSHFYHSPYLT